MNRIIKFRAWVKDNGKWSMRDWWLEMFSDMSPVTGYGSDFPEPDDSTSVLMQFTGAVDKNGKEIYEGDIVKHGNRIGKVEYIDALYSFQMDLSPHVLDQECGCDLSDTEVIGNVFEHSFDAFLSNTDSRKVKK